MLCALVASHQWQDTPVVLHPLPVHSPCVLAWCFPAAAVCPSSSLLLVRQELMAYVGAAFGSANADVRGAALRVAVVAAEAAGAAPVRRLLPQGMNPKMKEQVEHALGLEASPAPAGW